MLPESRIELIVDKFNEWLHSPGSDLKEISKKTYVEGYFHHTDISYAIRCLEKKVTLENLKNWTQRSLGNESRNHKKILCLHAGNLPLVGFQDALAVLLSGHEYYGKISRKDPYLLPDFLSHFKDTPLEAYINWNTDLQKYKDLKADAVTFSGSESSIPQVMEVIKSNNIAKRQSQYLIRKAHFSIVFFDEFNDNNSKNLVNALLRYDGKGCRSAAIVVSPIKLNSISCSFTDYFESYWMHNQTYQKPSPKLKYRYAYNKAVKKHQMLLEHLIIEQNKEPDIDSDDVIYWVPGDIETMSKLADKYGDQVQNLYVTSKDISIPDYDDKVDLLENAQCPAIDWEPDGIDVLEWLGKL